jgi:hypothetical protein
VIAARAIRQRPAVSMSPYEPDHVWQPYRWSRVMSEPTTTVARELVREVTLARNEAPWILICFSLATN